MMVLPTNGRSALAGCPERRTAATAMTAKVMASVATIADISKKNYRNVCMVHWKVILLYRKRNNNDNMIAMNAYFYGFYFYFASNCEAGSCV